MNREEYMAALEKHLRKLPKEEKENALVYYNEYFDDAGVENEDRVIGELGSPAKLAAQLRSEYALKDNGEDKKKMPVVLVVILSIFAAPIALPLVIVAAALVFCVMVVVFAFLFAFVVTAVSLALGGFLWMVVGLMLIFQSPASTLFYVGSGACALGLGILLGVGMYRLIPWVINGFKRMAQAILEWRKNA